MGFEPTTTTLATLCSTPELHPQKSLFNYASCVFGFRLKHSRFRASDRKTICSIQPQSREADYKTKGRLCKSDLAAIPDSRLLIFAKSSGRDSPKSRNGWL